MTIGLSRSSRNNFALFIATALSLCLVTPPTSSGQTAPSNFVPSSESTAPRYYSETPNRASKRAPSSSSAESTKVGSVESNSTTMQYQRVFAEFETSKGTFKGELFPLVAPKAVANFIGLATGTKKFIDAKNGQEVQRPFYKDQIFHRVVSNFLIQGGCPLGNGTGWPGYRFEDEFHPLYRHAKPGVMGMANAAPNQNGSQFYITLNAAPDLDNKHTIFGQVISGMNVVKAIGEVQTDINDRPVEKVELKNVKIIYQ